MTEIPEDVMKAAHGVVAEMMKEPMLAMAPFIARAILAERDRCCLVLRRLHEQQDGEKFDTKYLDIEEIIRSGA